MTRRASFKLEIGITLRDVDCVATAKASGYYDPGNCYGPIESSYPPDGECELEDVAVRVDCDGGAPVDGLTAAEDDYVTQKLEAEFWEQYDNG